MDSSVWHTIDWCLCFDKITHCNGYKYITFPSCSTKVTVYFDMPCLPSLYALSLDISCTNSLIPGQNGQNFVDIFKCISWNIKKYVNWKSVKCVWKCWFNFHLRMLVQFPSAIKKKCPDLYIHHQGLKHWCMNKMGSILQMGFQMWKFVPESPIENKSTLDLVMTWCQTDERLLFKPLMALFTDSCTWGNNARKT